MRFDPYEYWECIATINVVGVPKGQPRTRAFVRGDRAGVFDPGTADEWKMLVIDAARQSLRPEPITHALRCELTFFLPRPARLNGRRKPSGPVYCESRPDVDNLAKCVLDALQAVRWFADDKQVCSITIEKYFHALGSRPGVEIKLYKERSSNE